MSIHHEHLTLNVEARRTDTELTVVWSDDPVVHICAKQYEPLVWRQEDVPGVWDVGGSAFFFWRPVNAFDTFQQSQRTLGQERAIPS